MDNETSLPVQQAESQQMENAALPEAQVETLVYKPGEARQTSIEGTKNKLEPIRPMKASMTTFHIEVIHVIIFFLLLFMLFLGMWKEGKKTKF